MIDLEIDGKVYEMPQEWEDINVSQFQQLFGVLNENESIKKNIKVFKIMTNNKISDEYINRMDVNQFNELLFKFDFLFDKPEIDVDKENPININDIDYFLIDLEEISLGEWADLEFYISQADGSIINKLPELMSVLLRKKDEKYNGKISNKRIEEFKENASGIVGLKFIDFFFHSEIKFMNHLMNSSVEKMTKKEREALQQKTGGGLGIYMDYQENQS